MKDDILVPIVVSYENQFDSNVNAQFYRDTLIQNKWEYEFIGNGEKWNGFITRIIAYQSFLRTLPAEKIVVLSDARDVMCCRSSCSFMNSILPILRENKIIASAELFLLGRINWTSDQMQEKGADFFYNGTQLTEYWTHFTPPHNASRKYVNAGLMIGKATHLLELFNWIVDNQFTDDQLGVAHYMNRFPHKVMLDYEAIYLHSSTSGATGGFVDPLLQRLDSPSISELFGMSSYFLHIPGINGSKGQRRVYELATSVVKLIATYSTPTMHSMYDLRESDSYNPTYHIV